MTNDKKLMLLAGVLALGVLAGCSSASAASATSDIAASMAAASAAESAVSVQTEEAPAVKDGVVRPIEQGTLEELRTGSYKFAANITNVDAKKRQLTLTVYCYDAYRAEDVDTLEVGSTLSLHPDGAIEAADMTVESIERNDENGTVTINGGIEQGGVELWRSQDLYRTATFDDYPVYYSVGELVLPMSDDVTLSDSSSSVDAQPVETEGAIKVGRTIADDLDSWTPYNTTVFTQDGKVTSILRIWVP